MMLQGKGTRNTAEYIRSFRTGRFWQEESRVFTFRGMLEERVLPGLRSSCGQEALDFTRKKG